MQLNRTKNVVDKTALTRRYNDDCGVQPAGVVTSKSRSAFGEGTRREQQIKECKITLCLSVWKMEWKAGKRYEQ